MKKTFLLLVVFAFVGLMTQAQTIQTLYQDDFDSYTAGQFIAQENPTWWDTWSGAPGTGEDGLISDDEAFSPSNSVLVDETGGATDLISLLGDKTAGVYEVSWQMFVPAGFAGYYNFQHYQAPGIEWAVEVYFNADGTGNLLANGDDISFTYTPDTWFLVENYIDIDGDIAKIYLDGTMIHEWPWATQSGGGAGAAQLGGIDFFAGAQGSDVPKYYFDDFEYAQIFEPLYCDDFETYTVGGYIAEQNPTWWDTWSGAPGTGEDGMISDAQAYSGSNSVLVDETGGATDLILLLGDKSSGVYEVNWFMYVPSGFAGYFNFQHYEAPGIEWAVEVYFNADGTALLNANGEDINFTYSQDTWFEVVTHIDIDADVAEMYVDGTMVHTWPWATQASGGAGAATLGGVDFFAGAQGSDVPMYYFDDLCYLQLGGSTDPQIMIFPDQFSVQLEQGQSVDEIMTIENIGGAELVYDLAIVYDLGTDRTPLVNKPLRSKFNIPFEAGVIHNANNTLAPADDVVLHYDDDSQVGSTVGLTAPGDWEAAAMFPSSAIAQYAGMELSEVRVWIGDPDPADEFKVKIYGMGSTLVSGPLLYEQTFTPLLLADWNTITLNDPVLIDGQDIWVSIYVNQTTLTHPIGTDEGPANPLGDYIKTGVGWGHISPGIPKNWHIQATLTGTAIANWLTVDPNFGTVAAGASTDVTLTINSAGLDVGGYQASLWVQSNDPEHPEIEVPVVLDVTGGSVTSYCIDFENLPDFTLDFGDWTALDVDGLPTYSITDYTFPGQNEPMAFINFVPSMVTPAMTEPEIQPHTGDKFGACFASVESPWNDDWFISPQIELGNNSEFVFWVKSYTDAYGLEKYNVAVSTTGMEPADFTILNAAVLEAPVEAWEQQIWDLSDYDNQTVYVAIQCVSTDAFIFMIDDVCVNTSPTGINEPSSEAQFVVFPNPANDFVSVQANNAIRQISVFNYVGQLVQQNNAGTSVYTLNTTGWQAGVYFIQIETAQGISTQKVIIE
ncbi:MAG: choice-of-anchor J domain-containing protein [Bacteroidetes bacterium]|nr:choice-of-anchor J domain-containing protein [Bacteroidota bacterium]